MNDFFDVQYTLPGVDDKSVLVLGLGGGSDIILAYAFCRLLEAGGPRKIVYGNTKCRDDGHLVPVTEHISRVSEWRPSADELQQAWATTAIDHTVPRGDDCCPFVVLLTNRSVDAKLPAELESLGFDLLVGVDTGGDSLVDEAVSGPMGRDRRMLRVLEETDIPAVHIVAAPGSDGESTHKQLIDAIGKQQDLGRYLGCFPLEPVMDPIRALGRPLDWGRTPNIIARAADGLLTPDDCGCVVIPRCDRPRIRLDWLTIAVAFG